MPTLVPIAGPPITITSLTLENDVAICVGAGFNALTNIPTGVFVVNDTTLRMPVLRIQKFS